MTAPAGAVEPPGPDRLPPPRSGPAARLPKTPRGTRTRLRIIRAAEKVFGEKGFYETRISEITRRSGVALGTFYLYFASKEEIFRALVETLNRDLRRTLKAGTSNLRGRTEMEREGMRLFLEFLGRHQKLYRIVKQAEIVDPPLFRWYYHRIADGYARGLREAMEKGEIRSRDPELTAYVLMGIADFVGMRYVASDGGLSPEKLEELLDLILHGLVGP